METFYGHALKEFTSDILVCSVTKIYLVETNTEKSIVIESTANSDFRLRLQEWIKKRKRSLFRGVHFNLKLTTKENHFEIIFERAI